MIAVVGVGAIGGVCAAHLLAAGREVVCCARRPFEELVLETPDAVLRFRPEVRTTPSRAEGCDWILLATKAHQTEGAAGWLEAPGEGARVAVLQNGVEHVERLSHRVAPDRIVPVVVACPADAEAPGRIRQRAGATFTVPDDAGGRAFTGLFAGTSVSVVTTTDWTTAAWRKLCLNATSGPLAALAGVPLPKLRNPRARDLALALSRECAAVARAEGADVPDSFADRVAEGAVTTPPGGGFPSVLTDRRRGRPLEVDARNGAVVRIGRRHGIPTPLNARAAELMAEAHRHPETDLLPALSEALA